MILPVFYTIILLVIPLYLNAVEPNRSTPDIAISKFQPIKTSRNIELENQIYKKIQYKFKKKGYILLPVSSNSIARNLDLAGQKKAKILINGYYQKNRDGNLSLYLQFFDVSKKQIFDLVNITTDIPELEGIELDSEEMKVSDDEIIADSVQKTILRLRANPKYKQRLHHFEQDQIDPELRKKISAFLLKDKNKNASEAVFSFLQDQKVISATKISTNLRETPTIVNVVKNQDMIDYGYLSINDILYQLPGFSPSMDYDRRTVSFRGTFESWDNSHYMFLVDGLQFNDNHYGTAYTWEITPLNMIKSLEVIRGPGSALYGSNAISGVININTFSGNDLKGETRIRTRMGSNGTKIYDILTGNQKEYFSYIVSYNSHQTDGNNYTGYDGSGRTWPGGYLREFQKNDQRHNNYLFLKLKGNKNLEGLSFQYHRQYWNFQTVNGWLFYAPDHKETMFESRDLASLKFTNHLSSNIIQEYAIRYQKHDINWNAQMLPNQIEAFDSYYPDGAVENLTTYGEDILVRSQYTYLPNKTGTSILVGIEGSAFLYKGDKTHYSNTNLSPYNNSSAPIEQWDLPYGIEGIPTKQGDWLAWIKNKPLKHIGLFSQFVSGKILHRTTEITFGVRYDEMQQKFIGIDRPYKNFPEMLPGLFTPLTSDIIKSYMPEESRVMRTTNPRLAMVFFINKHLNIKAMAGTAFKQPSITNQFGGHTYMLAVENPRTLKPEKITTYDLGIDWIFWKNYNFRANVFHTKFENQIAYASYGASTYNNLYTLWTRGAEVELLYYLNKQISGFANFSYNKRINEVIQDKGVTKSPHATAWTPSNRGNVGLKYSTKKIHLALTLERQGKVYRRTSDIGTVFDDNPFNYPIILPDLEPRANNNVYYRPKLVSSWTEIRLRTNYQFNQDASLGVIITNLLNNRQRLIKTYNLPFDYHRDPRRILIDFNLVL